MARRPPKLQGSLLIVAKLWTSERQCRCADTWRGLVRYADAFRPEVGSQRGASVRRDAVNTDARVPANARERREIELFTFGG
jgi:hypothetical protein